MVVAEVKAPANQTRRSTPEITQHITSVCGAATASVTPLTRIEEAIGEVNTIAGSIAPTVEQRGATHCGDGS